MIICINKHNYSAFSVQKILKKKEQSDTPVDEPVFKDKMKMTALFFIYSV